MSEVTNEDGSNVDSSTSTDPLAASVSDSASRRIREQEFHGLTLGGNGYGSGTQRGEGSFLGRRAGRHAAARTRATV